MEGQVSDVLRLATREPAAEMTVTGEARVPGVVHLCATRIFLRTCSPRRGEEREADVLSEAQVIDTVTKAGELLLTVAVFAAGNLSESPVL